MSLYADILRAISPRPTMDDVADLIEGSFTSYLCTTTGSANAYIAAPSPALGALTSGARLWIITNFTNTGATTINVSSLGAKAVVDLANNALIGGEMISGELYSLIYDGTSWRLLNGRAPWRTWTPTLAGFSANPTGYYRYIQSGKFISLMIGHATNGTSNATNFTITAPVASANNGINASTYAVAVDNGSATATPVLVVLPYNSSTIALYTNVGGGGTWTNSGGKRTTSFVLVYEAA